MRVFTRSLLIIFNCVVFQLPEAFSVETVERPLLVPVLLLSLPYETNVPEVVFNVKNKGKKPLEVKEVFSVGSEISWTGPRKSHWVNATSSTSGFSSLLVEPESEREIAKIPLKELCQLISSQASLDKEFKLNDGDVFYMSWMVNGIKSNEIIIRYSAAKE